MRRGRDIRMCSSPNPQHMHTPESPYLELNPVETFLFDFPTSRTMRNKFLCLSHPVHCVLLWQPELGKEVVKAQLGATSRHLCCQVKKPRDGGRAVNGWEWTWTLDWSVHKLLFLFKQLKQFKMFKLFCLNIMRHNSDAIQFTHLECIIQCTLREIHNHHQSQF